MAFDPTNVVWTKTGCTVNSSGVITENTASDRHSIFQDIQARLIDTGFGTSAVYEAVISPLGRDRAWIGCRQNNAFFMASFLLSGSGSVTSFGVPNVSTASITLNLDGSYTCRVIYSGGLATTACVFALGAMIDDNTQTYLGTGIDAIRVHSTQLVPGTSSKPYSPTTDLSEYPDLQSAGGDNPAALPASSPPSILNPEFIRCTGGNGLDAGDAAIDRDAFTVVSVGSWDGTAGAEKVLAEQWTVPDGDDDTSWKMSLTTDGKLQVSLSGNGTTAAKTYTAVRALDVGVKTMCSFSWDGASLRLYYNDIELTTGGSELVLTLDGALSGNVFDSLAAILQGRAHRGDVWEFQLYTGAATPAEISSIASGFGLSGLPTGGGGSPDDGFPDTLAGLEAWLLDKGATSLRYVDNLTGNDSNAGTSTGSAWATIQKAANTLTPGQAVIIRGRGGRFFENVTIGASGISGSRIWYAGDPENPPILDASEAFSETWTDQGAGRWRAPYARSRPYSASSSYYTNCTTGNCVSENTWMSHQLIYADLQLVKIGADSVPSTIPAGSCYFQVGTGSYNTPQYVWCTLPGGVNPNSVSMRIGSNKVKLFDYSPHTWTQDGVAFPGGTLGQEVNGRDHIGIVNLNFRFGCNIRKVGMVAVRGTGWHIERCSFNETQTIGLTIHGSNHYIYNCIFQNNGQQGAFWDNAEGVEMQRCRIIRNNINYYPPSWEAGGMKIVECAQSLTCEIHECLFADNEGCGIWWDVDVGAGNPSLEAFNVHHCFFRNNSKGQVFFERRCEYLKLSDSVVWNGRIDNEGQSANNIGPGLRFQACERSTVERVTIVYNEGQGMLYKPDDGGGPANNDVFSRVAFIQNARGSSTSQGRNEYQGGDDPTYSRLWTTSTITNVLVSNNLSPAIDGLFRRRYPTPVTDTNTVGTFNGWSGATGTVSVADPLNVVTDPTDERGCYDFLPAYSAWAPVGLTHPDDFDTNWVVP